MYARFRVGKHIHASMAAASMLLRFRGHGIQPSRKLFIFQSRWSKDTGECATYEWDAFHPLGLRGEPGKQVGIASEAPPFLPFPLAQTPFLQRLTCGGIALTPGQPVACPVALGHRDGRLSAPRR